MSNLDGGWVILEGWGNIGGVADMDGDRSGGYRWEGVGGIWHIF